MERFGNHDFTISAEELQWAGITENMLYHQTSRYDSVVRVQNGLYLWSSLPDRWRHEVKYRLLGGLEPDRWFVRKEMEEELKHGRKTVGIAVRYAREVSWKTYQIHYAKYAHAKDYALACAILHEVALYMADNGIRPHRNLKWVVEELLPYVQDEKYFRGWQKSDVREYNKARRIQALLQQVFDGQKVTEVVKVKNAGAKHAAKLVSDPELMWWVRQLRMCDANLSDAFIMRAIQSACKIHGKPVPSDEWIRLQLKDRKLELLAAGTRWDKGNRYAQVHVPTLNFLPAATPDEQWIVDATRMNLESWKGADGRQKFLYIVAVRDNYSGDFIDYVFTTSDSAENRWAYLRVIGGAIAKTGRLPYELVTDRFPGHNSPEIEAMFERMRFYGCKVTVSHKAEAKSRLERSFGTLQTVFEQQSVFYYGEGVRSSREAAHRTDAWRKKARKLLQLADDAHKAMLKEAEAIVEAYRNTPFALYSSKYKHVKQSPNELYETGKKLLAKFLAQHEIADVTLPQRAASLRKWQVVLTVEGEERIYPVREASDLLRLTDVGTFTVRYDPDDAERVWLFRPENNEFLCELTHETRYAITGPEANWRKISGRQKEIRTIEQELEAMRQAPEGVAALDESQLIGYNGKEIDEPAEDAYWALPVFAPEKNEAKRASMFMDDDETIKPL